MYDHARNRGHASFLCEANFPRFQLRDGRPFDPTFQKPVQLVTILIPKWARQFLFETCDQFLRAYAFSRIALSDFPQRTEERLFAIQRRIRPPFPGTGFRFGIAQRRIAQHGTQHVKQPRPSFVADRLVSLGKMRRLQPLSQCHRSSIAQPLSIFVLAQKIPPILFQNLPELRRVLLLQHQERRIVRQTLRQPLIPITLPQHQIAPPLMRRLVYQDLAVELASHRIKMQICLLLRAQKREARQEDQPRPSLA